MKRIFEDILDDIDIEDKSGSSVISKLDPSADSVDVSRYDFVMHLGFYLGASYNESDKNVILKNANIIKEQKYCDYFNRVEKYLNVFVDEYWTDGLWYTNGGKLLDDLTEYKLKEISLIRFFYANKVYYIKFDNNYHHFFKFLQLYSNYFYIFLINMSASCVPYDKIKNFDDINSLMCGTRVETSYMRHKTFFIKSLEFNSREVNIDLNELRLLSKEQLRLDAENIYHYFYLDYKILKILDKFETEEEKIVFIEDYIWKLKLKGLKNK